MDTTGSTNKNGEDVIKRVEKHKEDGNRFFGKGDFPSAAESYRCGLHLLVSTATERVKTESALRSNLAMVYIKLGKFRESIQECDRLLAMDPQNTKGWYRRGLSREELGQWKEACDDLKHCLKLFPDSMTSVQQKMHNAASGALQRIEKRWKESKTPNTVKIPNGNMATQQRQDVIRLLMSRQVALKQQSQQPVSGEAFYLLGWEWWCLWCHHVDFFYLASSDNGNSSSTEKRQLEILKFLLPGSVMPPPLRQETDHDSDDSEDEENQNSSPPLIPRDIKRVPPIDNKCLLLEHETPYFKHWYADSTIRPNLVRGYDYELVPREVYYALSCWYGEVTTPICRRGTLSGKIQLYESSPKNNNNIHDDESSLRCGACLAPQAKSRCKQCMQIYYCGRACQESHWAFHKLECKNANNAAVRHPGKVGLHNLGNTCFMNSALQCLSHATPLTRHFLSKQYTHDLNVQNPLGTGGKLAHAYDQVLREIWIRAPAAASPTSLKRAIAMFAPRFGGCSQHDAQEFLAYLLDGLHEDLNRIRRAPYVEMPDVVGQHGIAGAEAWHAHKRRNDSLVMDTFYGQFKSTCICPRCDRVSVSFDAFNHVSLEIPQQKVQRNMQVIVFASGGGIPIRYMVQIRRNAFLVDLRKALSQLCKIPPSRLALCDIYENAVYEILPDNRAIASIRTTDVLAAYEVDPYTKNSIHVIGTHTERQEKLSSMEGKEEKAVESGKDLFGFPFFSSFGMNLTCKEMWGSIWNRVKHSARKVKDDEAGRVLRIRVVDNAGQPKRLFPQKDGNNDSLLPCDTDEKVSFFLGKDCTDRFLFISFEWSVNDEQIDTKAFGSVSNHSTYNEILQKQSATLNGQKGTTLDQCFRIFTRPERLDENNMWYCNKCKEHVRAMKTMELWRLPNILVVHLKRFEFRNSLRRDKLDTFVDFPLEGLDMGKHCIARKESIVDDKVPAIYDLFAVTNHYGRLGFGHYTAFARSWDESGMSPNWALFDDSSVRNVINAKETVVTPAAYVLFYRRRQFH